MQGDSFLCVPRLIRIVVIFYRALPFLLIQMILLSTLRLWLTFLRQSSARWGISRKAAFYVINKLTFGVHHHALLLKADQREHLSVSNYFLIAFFGESDHLIYE